MNNLEDIIKYLKEYDGPSVKLMEVCGTHTASIFKNGIRSLISDKIKLISGPGCPVCVTPAAYIDKTIELSKQPNHMLLTFGDMMKVPGATMSLAEAKAEGAKVEIIYSPLDALEKATKNPDTTYVVAAVGFETTIPTYALLVQQALERGLTNIQLVTALKTVVPALEWICKCEPDIDGFICPGHASIIVGLEPYIPLADQYNKPFVIAGFEAEHILVVLYDILKQLEVKKGKAHNLYTNVVRNEGNIAAQQLIADFFTPGTAVWRGIGAIENSGLYLKKEYEAFDSGSRGLDTDVERSKACKCGAVIIGKINPDECPLFAKVCTPLSAQGPCMVSSEGSCGVWYKNVIH